MRLQQFHARTARQQTVQGFVIELRSAETPDGAAFPCRDRYPVTEQNAVARDGRYPLVGREDTDEIQRIGTAHDDQLTAFLQFSNRAHAADRVRQSKLLAAKTGNETPTADFPARFEPAINHDELAPRRQPRFTREERAENHTVALEQCACDRFD